MTKGDDGSASTEQHRAEAAQLYGVRCVVITVSDSRTVATDESGALMERLLIDAGHVVVERQLLKNDEDPLRAALVAALERTDVDAVLCTGGTGLGSRDRTVEVVRPLLERELPGFGELFRSLSYLEQIGAAAMLSRAIAGAARGKFVAVMPGSKAAVELALTRLIIPEIKHALRELRR
ncbi:MAG: MogA/MoaB family molybdenum cofactor biosynthesis protein [Gemmatimonadaceae bacterium]|nr:MogA/MoaB family molybdenum cofactor biosynthesis protein [Gemmatimonadaceae bacterium]